MRRPKYSVHPVHRRVRQHLLTNNERTNMSDCKHQKLTAWHTEDGKPAGFWSCAICGHKFVPLNLAQEKDAQRYRKLQAQATKKTAYDVYGNGCLWSIGIHSEDSRLPFAAVVDALLAVGAA